MDRYIRHTAHRDSEMEALKGTDYSDWEAGDWNSYFAEIRNSKGKSAAEKELQERIDAGDIPKK